MGTQSGGNKIPVTFTHNQIIYTGHLSPVSGAGQQMWQLIGNGFFLGNLRVYKGNWVLDSNKMPEMAGFLGDYLTAWHQ